jgi:hypothetical protein
VARLYSNENIPFEVVLALRRFGHDVLTSLEAGNANAAVPDEAVLDFARRQERVFASHNRKHFLRLHEQRTVPHAGMVLCTFDGDPGALAQRIDVALSGAGELRDIVLRVNRE